MIRIRQISILSLAMVWLLAPPGASALVLDDSPSCLSLGGTWSGLATPPRIGQCVLHQNYTLPAGQALDLTASVSLTIKSHASLTIDGRLGLAGHARLVVNNGSILNRGEIVIADDAILHLWSGLIENRSNIFNEGFIKNKWQPGEGRGILNNGRIDNVDGGVIANAGLFVNDGDSILINGVGGEMIHYSRARYVANYETHLGKVLVDRGATLEIDGNVSIDDGGSWTSAGLIIMRSPGTSSLYIAPNGRLVNKDRAVLKLAGWHSLSVDGTLENQSASVENHHGGTININNGGAIVSTDSLVYNGASSMVINKGRFEFHCSRWKNDGSFAGTYFSYCNSYKK